MVLSKTNRRRSVLLMVVVWAGVGMLAEGAAAQARLSQETIVATEGLTEAQRDQLGAFLDQWVSVLKDPKASEKRVTEARTHLIEPLQTPGATDFFKQAYSEALSERLKPSTDSKRLLTRLNIAVLAGRMTSEGGVGLARKALADKSPAVRYWGARGMANVLSAMSDQAQLPIKQKLQLLDSLGKVGRKATSTEVLKQVMQAMVALDQPDSPLPKALPATLDLLSERLRWHVNRPFKPFLAEQAGLGAVYQRLLNSDNPDPSQVKQLASLSNRYMSLIADHLSKAKQQARANGGQTPIDPDAKAQHAQVLKLTNFALRYAYSELGSKQERPPDIGEAITFENWQKVRLVASQWRRVLSAAPINVPQEELQIVDQDKQAGTN